jgi:hypothetical protein
MNIARRILRIAARIIIGIFAFYLILTLILIPLASPWLIRSQASKILKATVKLRSVQFNPFLLRLTVKGLEILDSNKQSMVGFEKFWADVSFISLLKKSYRVESLGLDGLKVNLVLAGNGSINLLELAPKEAVKPAEVKGPANKNAATEAKPLPVVVIDLITMSNGSVRFTDQSVSPNFTTFLNGMSLNVTGFSTSPDSEAKISFRSRLDEQGDISNEAIIKPFASPLALEMVFKLNSYALGVLTPYVGKYTGHKVKDGKLDLSMNYRIADNQLKASHKILVQRFDFGDRVESKDALNLPFGFALALLEDSRGQINISVPVSGDMSKPDFHLFQLIGRVFRNFFFKIITKPFSILGSMMGEGESSSEELGYIRFLPGKSDLAETEKAKLLLIIKALNERSMLRLEVSGTYDPVVDWKVMKTDVLNHDFSVLMKESKRPESWVYQELYQRRFGIQSLWRLTKSYRSKGGLYDDIKMNEEIKRQLVEDKQGNKIALKALAEARSQVIYDFMIAAGFDAKRISIGEPREGQGNADFVPLELTLAVLDDAS